jgi:hypothetical protein
VLVTPSYLPGGTGARTRGVRLLYPPLWVQAGLICLARGGRGVAWGRGACLGVRMRVGVWMVGGGERGRGGRWGEML